MRERSNVYHVSWVHTTATCKISRNVQPKCTCPGSGVVLSRVKASSALMTGPPFADGTRPLLWAIFSAAGAVPAHNTLAISQRHAGRNTVAWTAPGFTCSGCCCSLTKASFQILVRNNPPGVHSRRPLEQPSCTDCQRMTVCMRHSSTPEHEAFLECRDRPALGAVFLGAVASGPNSCSETILHCQSRILKIDRA